MSKKGNDSCTTLSLGLSSEQHYVGEKEPSRRTNTVRREPKNSSRFDWGSVAGSDPLALRVRPSVGTPRSIKKIHRQVWFGRVGFVCCLATVAAALGTAAFEMAKTTEKEFAQSQFESIADRALAGAHDVAKRKRFTLMTMADIISNEFPSVLWPFVRVKGYERIVQHLARSGSHKTMGFAPFVPLDRKEEWEDFAYGYFDTREDFPNTTGVNDLGKGIWRLNNETGREAERRVPDTVEEEVFAPVFQIDSGPDNAVLLYNLHSEKHRSDAIDSMIHYHQHRNMTLMATGDDHDNHQIGGVLTDNVEIFRYKTQGPASIMMHPIFPVDSPHDVTGLVFSLVVWDELFENLFNKDVQGVHCVLKSDTHVHTYTIRNGLVASFEENDTHCNSYDHLGRHLDLTPEELYPIGTRYTLSLYPTDDFFQVYATDNPRNSALIAVIVIALTTSFFLLYDFFVRKETRQRIQILEAKRRFIRYVSHEVRTPLNAVCMGLAVIHTELLEAMRPSDGSSVDFDPTKDNKAVECMHLLEEVQAGARSAVDVLNAVLQYDKIEQSTLVLEINMVPIFDLVEKTIGEFKLSAAQKQVHLKVLYQLDGQVEDVEQANSPASDLPDEVKNLRVAGDTARLAQVLRNLLSNALKFTPAENLIVVRTTYKLPTALSPGSVGTVALQDGRQIFAEPKGTVVFSVEDSGAGMTEEQLACLFGEFVQFNVNELQAGKGSGLGLFITKGLVEQHKGSLIAASGGLGKGSTFSMTLPIFSVPNCDTPIEDNMAPDTGKARMEERPDNLKILVVDDALSNRKLLSRLLQMKGHHCDMAENGQVAVEKVRETMISGELYDAVLCDFEMPIMDGPTAANEIRQMGSDVFLVGITGNMLEEDVEYFKSQGAHTVLPKPLQLPLLEQIFMEHGIIGSSHIGSTKTTVGSGLSVTEPKPIYSDSHHSTNATLESSPSITKPSVTEPISSDCSYVDC